MSDAKGLAWPLVVINAYSGSGKSAFTRVNPTYKNRDVIDLDSYEFTHDVRTQQVFPENYINAVRMYRSNAAYQGAILFVSTHPDFMRGLDAAGIKHVVVCPHEDVSKEDWLRRIEGRDEDNMVYEKLQQSYGEHLIDLGGYLSEVDKDNVKYYKLQADQYIGDVIDSILAEVG